MNPFNQDPATPPPPICQMKIAFNTALAALAGAYALAGAARADEIVVNGGFETPNPRSAQVWDDSLSSAWADDPRPTSWVELSGTEAPLNQVGGTPYAEWGVLTAKLPPTAGWLPATPNGGSWAFYLQAYGGGYNGTKQDLGTLTAGTKYTVSADFARNSGGSLMNYDFFLLDGTSNTALAGIDELSGGVPAVGTWANKSFIYTATSGVAGHELWIVLRARTASDSIRGGIDNVSVIATAATLSSKDMISFDIGSSVGVIDNDNHTVAVEVPYATGLSSLTPTIEVSPNAGIVPASGAAQNFTNPVTYTVTAEDGLTQTYVVTVAEAPNNLVRNGGFENPNPRDTFYNGLNASYANDPWAAHWAELSGAEPQLSQAVGALGGGENGVETAMLPPAWSWLPANANGGVWAFMLQGYGGGYNGTKQDLGTIVAGTTYAVSADFAQNGNNPMNYDFFLMDGTTNSALAGIDELTGGIPAAGSWTNKSFTYTATGADAGHELWIVMRARVPSGDAIRGGIDNVRVVPTSGGSTATSYATWASANGASLDPLVDSNGNGVADGIEFFMGGTLASPAMLPPLVNTADTWSWSLPYDPNAAASYLFQVSDDLNGWTDVVPGPTETRIVVTPPVSPATLGTVKLILPAGTGRKFCRLAIATN